VNTLHILTETDYRSTSDRAACGSVWVCVGGKWRTYLLT